MTGPSKIYVVDDERIIASTLALILKQSGYDATAFFNPLEVLQQEKADLVISDVVMPEMTGIDLALRLKEESPRTKVILFSGQAQTSDLIATAAAEGNNFDVLAKPVHPTVLLARVKDIFSSIAEQ